MTSSIGDNGAVFAQSFHGCISSAFKPVIRASDGALIGHHALLRVQGAAGERIAPRAVVAQAVDESALVKLDRLCRTVHLLNYLPSAEAGSNLFLDLESRLLSDVTASHGAFHDSILALMGIAPGRVVIVMPPSAFEKRADFVRAAISYRIRGYRVLAQVRSIADADDVLLADPHYVVIDSSAVLEGAAARRFLDALANRGIQLIGVAPDFPLDTALPGAAIAG